MLTHTELLDMWEADAALNKMDLDDEAVAVPMLHHKYLRLLMDHQAMRIKVQSEMDALLRDKEMYYSGASPADVYRKSPFDLKLKTKSAIEKYVAGDKDVVMLHQKLEYLSMLIDGIKQIMSSITYRNNSIKAAIEWSKFQSGEIG